MAKVRILHNPHCNSSVNAVRIAEELGVDAEIVLYMKTPLDAPALEALVDKLEDPVTALVRRDSLFTKLGLTEADVQTRGQVVALLAKRKALLQRPIVITPDKAIVGRPKERIRELLSRR
jgi:arsenate reductase (glutaredoxin)